MPKLKAALLTHQANANRYAQQQRSKQRAEEQAKAARMNANGVGKGKKRKLKEEKGKEKAALDLSAGTSTGKGGSVAGIVEDLEGNGEEVSKSHGVDITAATGSPAQSSSTPLRKATIPFDKTDTILLLGEANFSFAASLLHPPHFLSGHMICATSYDPEEVCYKKYPDAEENVRTLKEGGVRVKFGVDAGDLPKDITGGGRKKGKGRVVDGEYGGSERYGQQGEEGGGRWSRVIFNFPHAGAGITDQDRNILSNQHLLLRTLRSVHPILTSAPSVAPPPKKRKRNQPKKSHPDHDFDGLDDDDDLDDLAAFDESNEDATLDVERLEKYQTPAPSSFTPPLKTGTILFTLLDQNPYTQWNLPHLASKPPPTCPGTRLPQPKFRLVRSFEFRPEVYKGYSHRRTIGFKVGVSKDGNEEIVGRKGRARTWEFEAVKPGEGVGGERRLGTRGDAGDGRRREGGGKRGGGAKREGRER